MQTAINTRLEELAADYTEFKSQFNFPVATDEQIPDAIFDSANGQWIAEVSAFVAKTHLALTEGKVVNYKFSDFASIPEPGALEYLGELAALEELKFHKTNEIKTAALAYLEAMPEGCLTKVTDSAGEFIRVDATRSDWQNFKGALEYMQSKDIQQTSIRCANNKIHEVSQKDLQSIIDSVYELGLAIYQTKWVLEAEIKGCRRKEDVLKIKF